MRRRWRSNPIFILFISLIACALLIGLSASGLSRPFEGIAAAPLNFLTGIFNRVTLTINNALGESSDVRAMRERIYELEEQLAIIQADNIQLREISNDYERLSDLLSYTSAAQNQEFVTAEVLGLDPQASVRSIIINQGTRSGLEVGMPVVTQLGLVGRIIDVSANAANVQLVTDSNSAISGRLENSRAEGSVVGRGLINGTLEMEHIQVDTEITEGELVVTSGLGGNLPADLVIGQVTSYRDFEFELSQTAQLRSLIDFNTLEFVLVITNFEPADISVFEEETDVAP
ncbi:rod shape-determining protein MreC [Phototrophicus methaneseepsis]|uniref:Cell shape-determining protein MreC n=1 Tax=Phototrophicus methaneseepsis TaxID=2710758 RepID=A0A7S8E769_9CHLR|nr:rod shape-determining protein MreC [Phototrophicus methaneseepsis]QPC81622.1 rod shape-determining protein MreC [Phototrophicus methaneseepsis]